uniref:BTB domain-containing protein n=1 Tax=Panagrolaimus davidi TaxID=227884 RepID=A0A914P0G9_9BILA
MTSWIFLEEMQRKFNDAFESQNPAMFDVVFDIDGKKLYADKLRLTLASTTFESMFSDRWGYKDDIIPIKNYKFDDFKGFLSFIYSAKCDLNDNNIMAILDMAAFYQIERLKELCEEYLSKIYEWAKYIAFKKQKESNNENFNMNDAIKTEIDAIKKIKSVKNRPSDNTESLVLYWSNINCKFPSSPSQYKQNDDVKDHLVVFSDGNIGVVRNPFGAYTLAEMTSEKYFEFTPNCKIEIE